MGACTRRLKARLGKAEGSTATAHKLARIFCRLVKHGEDYVRQGMEEYEQKYRDAKLKALQINATALGFELVHKNATLSPVS